MARSQLIVGYIFYYRSVGKKKKKKIDLVYEAQKSKANRFSQYETGRSKEFSVGQSRDKSLHVEIAWNGRGRPDDGRSKFQFQRVPSGFCSIYE